MRERDDLLRLVFNPTVMPVVHPSESMTAGARPRKRHEENAHLLVLARVGDGKRDNDP